MPFLARFGQSVLWILPRPNIEHGFRDMSPEKAFDRSMLLPGSPTSGTTRAHHRNGRLGFGYGHVITLMLGACMFGVVLHSQFQTSCRVWEKGTMISLWSGNESKNTTTTHSALIDSSKRFASTRSKGDEPTRQQQPKQSSKKVKSNRNADRNQFDGSLSTREDTNDRPWPRIVWLMSFPNSGTSYTLKMIHYLTDRTTATNYGDRHRHSRTGKSVSVYANDDNNAGPFWTEPEEKYDKKRPTTYVLTKTHCGGSCALCGPHRHIETPHSFLEQCESGLRGVVDEKGKRMVQSVRYDARTTVSRAVHLIRHPLDNIVSRFHLEWNENKKFANSTVDGPWVRKEFPVDFERDPTGFRSFCKAMAKRYESQYKKSRFINDDMIKLLEDVPCYGDLMRWIQWHNLASWTTRELQLPTFILYYETYSTQFNQTIADLLDFIQQSPVGSLVPFISGKSYAETYFTEKEREIVKKAMKMLAFRDTWKLIEHYF